MPSDLDALLARIRERGCPVCDDSVDGHVRLGPTDVRLQPCGHRATEL